MVNNELYMEVKHKWRSIYPIYFDSSKTLQQGKVLLTQAEDFQRTNAWKNPHFSNSSEQSVPANYAT